MARRRDAGGSRLLTIMFTDIEGSTALTQRLGDVRAQELLRVHNQLARRAIARWGGREIKHTGDGVMATFTSASSAVAAATSMQEAVREHNEANPDAELVINVGLNAGEPVSEDADVFGSAVQLAARVCGEAKGGQVLATNVVRELVQGKGVLFGDRGLAELKGFDEPVRLFDVAGVEPETVAAAGRASRRPRWALGAGGAAAALVVGVAGVLLATRDPDRAGADDDDGSALPRDEADAEATLYEYTVQGSTELVSVTGDCVSTDTEVAGTLDQQARGDVVGVASTEYVATIELARECQGMHLVATSVYELSGGTFVNPNQGLSLQTLGDNVTSSRFSNTVALGFIEQGTGVYEGATGFNICRSDTLRNTAELTNSSTCELRVFEGERPSLVVAAVADTDEVDVGVGAGAARRTMRYLVVVMNPADEPVDGAVLSLSVSEGAQVRAEAVGDLDARSELSWDLGSLEPGEGRWVELLVEVDTASGDLVLTPQVTVGDDTTVGFPATVRIHD